MSGSQEDSEFMREWRKRREQSRLLESEGSQPYDLRPDPTTEATSQPTTDEQLYEQAKTLKQMSNEKANLDITEDMKEFVRLQDDVGLPPPTLSEWAKQSSWTRDTGGPINRITDDGHWKELSKGILRDDDQPLDDEELTLKSERHYKVSDDFTVIPCINNDCGPSSDSICYKGVYYEITFMSNNEMKEKKEQIREKIETMLSSIKQKENFSKWDEEEINFYIHIQLMQECWYDPDHTEQERIKQHEQIREYSYKHFPGPYDSDNFLIGTWGVDNILNKLNQIEGEISDLSGGGVMSFFRNISQGIRDRIPSNSGYVKDMKDKILKTSGQTNPSVLYKRWNDFKDLIDRLIYEGRRNGWSTANERAPNKFTNVISEFSFLKNIKTSQRSTCGNILLSRQLFLYRFIKMIKNLPKIEQAVSSNEFSNYNVGFYTVFNPVQAEAIRYFFYPSDNRGSKKYTKKKSKKKKSKKSKIHKKVHKKKKKSKSRRRRR